VEASALYKQGWSISAIARHLGRDRKTIRAYVNGDRQPGERQPAGPDVFAPFEPYVRARFAEDPHVWATALFDEVVALGYPRAYQSFTREVRVRGLRPDCAACSGVGGRATTEIDHPPSEEIQWDWLELPAPPWEPDGKANLLVGTLPHSGRSRGVFAESQDQAHLVEAIDGVLRRLGGTARRWRFDRMGTVVEIGTDRLPASFAQVAKYYGAHIDVCPPRAGNRKGAVEAANRYIAQRWWRTATVETMEDAQASLDVFLAGPGDQRRRGEQTIAERAEGERLLDLPAAPYPATVTVQRKVGRSALVSFRGNRYSVHPNLIDADVQVRARLGSDLAEIATTSGAIVAVHRLAPFGAQQIVRAHDHAVALETAVLEAFTTDRPCHRKPNRPPGPDAQAAASVLLGRPAVEPGDAGNVNPIWPHRDGAESSERRNSGFLVRGV
jgi:transposase